ncbi:GNAT family N-acetyltransferase [Staphylococcus sp. SQ8-PEA]|uniref:GNAT family N-acetyltransferase n=1 Tax=Staphylococcus marylandisciuri TaxID=2981529 RepID=A0ABT2QMG8_9STAP|nr:GNAT family N-acetyltransferase [Staphylococcus marylandisciuri]MCU5745166.1 GNAT family N-acetyltransferase [Staphylococcus marylandisciuri]
MTIHKLTDCTEILKFIENADYTKTSYLYKLPQEHHHIQQMIERAIHSPGVFAIIDDNNIKALVLAFTYEENKFKVIGPIISHGYHLTIEEQDDLLNAMFHAQPDDANFNFSYDATSQVFAKEMKHLKASYHFTDYYLEAYPEIRSIEPTSYQTITEYHKAYFRAFKKLHEKAFKRNEMSASQIVDSLDENNRLFIFVSEGLLKGYIYIQTHPRRGIAEIKYFTSHSDYRFKGIAFDLLKFVLNFAFDHYELKKIYFKIRSKNSRLVQRFNELGFHVNNEYKKFKYVAKHT